MTMKVLLISTYELGRQPLGVASPAAQLLARGCDVSCLDLAVQPFDEAAVRRAEFIGISVPMHTAIRLGAAAATRVRALNPGAHICFYGLYASLNGGFLLRSLADSVIGGEYEEPLADLVKQMAAGGGAAPPPGVRTPATPGAPFLGRPAFRLPARHLLPPLTQYARLDTGTELRLAGCVEASHGCAHECLHCPITPVYEGRFRIVPRDVVMEDVHQLHGMGARHITFGDPDFLNGIRHSMSIARRLHAELPDVTFDVTAKIEHIVRHPEIVRELSRLGCVFIVSAAEILNDRTLELLQKGHTGADIRRALHIAGEAGVALRPSWMPFTPWTSIEDYMEILDFIDAEGLWHHVDPVQLSIRMLLPPGSSLLGRPELTAHLGSLDESMFSHEWKHPDPRMDELQREVNRIVEEASKRREDPPETFWRIRDHVSTCWPHVRSERPSGMRSTPFRPPRLTEAWFC
jgi:radical SAM superfamily enzyme YgiQ (UPF0313 family)